MLWVEHNLDDVLSAFWELVGRTTGIAGEIVRAAAKRAEELIRERAPRRTGALRESVRSTIEGTKAYVGPTAGYAHFLEWGTRPHEIMPRQARALRFMLEGRVVFAKRVVHPGIRPRLFVLSAAEALRAELEGLSMGVLRDVIG